MKMGHIATLTVLMGLASMVSAGANVVEISSSGTWNSSASTTPESGPGLSWSFSFDVANPVAPFPGLTTSASNFIYDLNGSTVPVGFSSIQFFPLADSGMFTLVLTDGFTMITNGADIGSSGNVDIGSFPFNAGIAPSSFILGSGTITLTALAAAPEPASLALLGGALGLFLLTRRANRRDRQARLDQPGVVKLAC